MAETWSDLKHDPTIKLAGQWQVRHVGGQMHSALKAMVKDEEAIAPAPTDQAAMDSYIGAAIGSTKKEDIESYKKEWADSVREAGLVSTEDGGIKQAE